MTVAEIKQHNNFCWHCGCERQKPAPGDNTKRKTPSGSKIVQLNVDGWRGKDVVVKQLLGELEADVLVIQETKLTPDAVCPLGKNWTTFRRERTVHRTQNAKFRPQGGIAIAVRTGIPCAKLEDLPLTDAAALETLRVEVSFGKRSYKIWNIYRPPARGGADNREANPHTELWPKTEDALICADINGHGSWEDFLDSDAVGSEVDEWCFENQMSILNSGQATRIGAKGNETSPDITVSHVRRKSDLRWKVLPTIGSDHLPLLITVNEKPERRKKKNLNFKKANGEAFQVKTESLFLKIEPGKSIEQHCKRFSDIIRTVAKQTIPVTNRKEIKPWWNQECEKAKNELKASLTQLRRTRGSNDIKEQRRIFRR